MTISEMRSRENFDEIFAKTLSKGWTAQYGVPTHVMCRPNEKGQLWKLQPLFGAFYSSGISPHARKFMRDFFRFTPVPWRIFPQWAVGSILSTSSALNLFYTLGFWVTPRLTNAQDLLIVPGNQRLRIFNFKEGVTRVFLKVGFDNNSLRTEIKIRGTGKSGPFQPITSFDKDFTWFEEQILEAYALPRCPPWFSKQQIEIKAFQLLHDWTCNSIRDQEIYPYLDTILHSVNGKIKMIFQKYNISIGAQIQPLIDTFTSEAKKLDFIALAATHGDFQAGNIMVNQKNKRISIIDWEHYGIRSRHYDYLVYGLKTRSANGLAKRVMAFLEGNERSILHQWLPIDVGLRRAVLALFFLEDLNWFLSESLTGPFKKPSTGLLLYIKEMYRLRTTYNF